MAGIFKSGFEKLVGGLFRKAKIPFGYETVKVPYTLKSIYNPDFIIGDIYIETKGRFTSADRRKMKAVKEQHPELDIRLWFQADNWITKKKKQRYSDWAIKNGFPYHVGSELPKEWFKDKCTKKKKT